MSAEPRECPFCGTTEITGDFINVFRGARCFCICSECDCAGPFADGDTRSAAYENAVSAWNRRAPPAVQSVPLSDAEIEDTVIPLANYPMTKADVNLFLPQWRKVTRAVEAAVLAKIKGDAASTH